MLDQQAAGSTARRNGLDGMAPWYRPQIAMASSLGMRGGVAALGAWSRPSASREPGLRSTASGCQGTPGRLHRCAVAEYGHTVTVLTLRDRKEGSCEMAVLLGRGRT